MFSNVFLRLILFVLSGIYPHFKTYSLSNEDWFLRFHRNGLGAVLKVEKTSLGWRVFLDQTNGPDNPSVDEVFLLMKQVDGVKTVCVWFFKEICCYDPSLP